MEIGNRLTRDTLLGNFLLKKNRWYVFRVLSKCSRDRDCHTLVLHSWDQGEGGEGPRGDLEALS